MTMGRFPVRRPSAGAVWALLRAAFTLRFNSNRFRGSLVHPATPERGIFRRNRGWRFRDQCCFSFTPNKAAASNAELDELRIDRPERISALVAAQSSLTIIEI